MNKDFQNGFVLGLVSKGAVILQATYPFEQVEIVPESELPEDAEILGGVDNKDEVM
jgi:hypothetical protein